MSKEIEWEFLPEPDLTYLKQPRDVYNIQHSSIKYLKANIAIILSKQDHYVYHTDGKHHYRRIFYGVDYTEYEKASMRQLLAIVDKENIELPPDWDDAQTLKYCYSGGFEIKKCVESLKIHLAWKQDRKMQKMNRQAQQLLEQGIFYHLGRDKQFRPIIVLNVWKVNPKSAPLDVYLSAVCNLLVKIASAEFVQGFVESWVVILETNEKGITDLDISTITKLVQIMAKNFASTLEKMFILNPSFLFSSMWGILKGIIHPETAAKINLLKKKDFGTLQNFIDADQLEVKYGGTIPNLSEYWPPVNTLKQSPMSFSHLTPKQGNQNRGNDLDSYDGSFKSIINDSQLFFDKETTTTPRRTTTRKPSQKGAPNLIQQNSQIRIPNSIDFSSEEIQPPKGGCCGNKCVIF